MVHVGGRDVALSSLDRVMFPSVGFTKRDLVEYYGRVASRLLPHLDDHPLTLRRFPSGTAGPDFFQSRAPAHPPWITTTTLYFPRTGKTFETVVVDGPAALLWAVNLSTVEFHPYLGRVGAPDRPTAMVFDLDPGAPAGLFACAQVALLVREQLDGVGLTALVKSSGGLGLHVYVPLGGGDTFEDTKAFARAVAAVLQRRAPDLIVDVMTRSARAGKVFIDWGQNDAGKSTVAPYSLRAVYDAPTVSLPLEWDEVAAVAHGAPPETLLFGAVRALERIEATSVDPFAPAVETNQTLPTDLAQSG